MPSGTVLIRSVCPQTTVSTKHQQHLPHRSVNLSLPSLPSTHGARSVSFVKSDLTRRLPSSFPTECSPRSSTAFSGILRLRTAFQQQDGSTFHGPYTVSPPALSFGLLLLHHAASTPTMNMMKTLDSKKFSPNSAQVHLVMIRRPMLLLALPSRYHQVNVRMI